MWSFHAIQQQLSKERDCLHGFAKTLHNEKQKLQAVTILKQYFDAVGRVF